MMNIKVSFHWINLDPTFLFTFSVMCYYNAEFLLAKPVFTDLNEEKGHSH